MQPQYGAPPPQQYGPPPPPPPGPKRYGIFAAYILAPFFVGSLYRDVGRNWRGIGFWCMFLLLAITWAVTLGKFHVEAQKFVRDEVPKALEHVPAVTIKDGEASSDVPQPYEMKEPDSGRVFAVIDTTGQINSLDDTSAIVLLTKTKLFVKDQNNGQVREIPLKTFGNVTIDKKFLQGWADWIGKWMSFVVYFPALLGSVVFRLIQMLIYGLIGLAFASMFNARLDYAALMRLSVMSIIPILLLDTIFSLTGARVPLWNLIGIGVAMIYLLMAVKANGEQTPSAGYAFPVGPVPGQQYQQPYQPPRA